MSRIFSYHMFQHAQRETNFRPRRVAQAPAPEGGPRARGYRRRRRPLRRTGRASEPTGSAAPQAHRPRQRADWLREKTLRRPAGDFRPC